MSVVPGSRVDSYELLDHLGSGGMGTVYRAHDSRLGRDVAIKFLKETSFSDAKALRRFEREARAASALSHPNIVTINDIGKTDSSPYIVMEFLRGRTLRETFGAGPLKTPDLVKLALQVSDGLARAHEAGIVHRDLKPHRGRAGRAAVLRLERLGLEREGRLRPVLRDAVHAGAEPHRHRGVEQTQCALSEALPSPALPFPRALRCRGR